MLLRRYVLVSISVIVVILTSLSSFGAASASGGTLVQTHGACGSGNYSYYAYPSTGGETKYKFIDPLGNTVNEGSGTGGEVGLNVYATVVGIWFVVVDFPDGVEIYEPFTVSDCGNGQPPSDFVINCYPSSLTVSNGASATSTCYTQSNTGYNLTRWAEMEGQCIIDPHLCEGFYGSISSSCAEIPSGVSCSFDPNPVTLSGVSDAYTYHKSTMTVTANSPSQYGNFPFHVIATGAGITHSANMSLIIPFFVVPESPIGIIALMASSLAVLGGFIYFRQYKSRSTA